MDEEEIGREVVDIAIGIHRDLGPGLLESVYERIFESEIRRRGMTVERQVPVCIEYRGLRFEEGFRADLVIENRVILELKSVERISDAHKKQLLTYLRLTGLKLGFVMNFGEVLMRRGITRIVNGLAER
jgi:GxxExxY protein